MPKNMLFLLRNCKNRQTLSQLQSPLTSVTLHIVNCSFCICLQSIDSFGINQKTFIL